MTEPLLVEIEAFGSACATGVPPGHRRAPRRRGGPRPRRHRSTRPAAAARRSRSRRDRRTLAAWSPTTASLADDVEIGPFCVVGMDGDGRRRSHRPGRDRLRSHVVVYRGTRLGGGFHAGHHVLVREAHHHRRPASRSAAGTIVEHHVTLGDGVRLHSRLLRPRALGARGGRVARTRRDAHERPLPESPRHEGQPRGGAPSRREAVLGAGVVVLPGVTIGRGALVGAGRGGRPRRPARCHRRRQPGEGPVR